ncbi:DUF3857 domain-containing transglutaminase family protein [Salinimicrobium oceani]|uniref:DUF3857 and transglutaminase domain-containing protein n=1 Tax=Salinimicrobium oceani TaxID=2722702 RepID=A0ABX1D0N8_9FLAO|nr:DUF3857 and transglutaminase domain-containing protein [Salinimicrobium oceani]NJW54079.1 DUF3857 and transglutaminase domain-containing protein [Salinimicrobium oceani]
MFRIFSLLLMLFISAAAVSQSSPYAVNLIDSKLKENSNAVVREEILSIAIEAVDKMRINTRKVVTILNEKGDRYAFAGDFYSDNSRIKHQSLFIYDKNGAEIKKIKAKQFNDRSAISSGTLYSDTRVSYAEFTPREYPYTVVYESEVEMGSTIFLPDWSPVRGFYVSVEKSTYKVINTANIEYRIQERNMEELELEKDRSSNGLTYTLQSFPAYRYETLSPPLQDFTPQLLVALNEFSLVGVKGSGSNWNDFGKWQYDNLIAGRNQLPAATVKKITALTSGAKDDVEKARIIYDYVQQNSRYISVQLGIGGWEPIPAAEVDQVKYGDCKGLTNYTKALLDSQNIPSYYAVVYAGEEKKDIDPNFVSMQGNHVILNLPQEGKEDIWLECTSQTLPFNYLGDFTDERHVLLLKPEGGEIVKTRTYAPSENTQESKVLVSLAEDGSFSGSLERLSKGIPYGNIYGISTAAEKDQVLFYKKQWGHLKDLNLETPVYVNDREKHEFLEQLQFTGTKYMSKAGNRLLLPLTFLSLDTYSVSGRDGRNLPIKIGRGGTEIDHFEFELPQGFDIEAMPEPVNIESEFGSFSMAPVLIEKEGKKYIKVDRSYTLNEGTWPASSLQEFREFMYSIHALGNQKAVLVKSD